MPKVSLEEGLSQFADLWRPKIIAELNDYKVQLVKVHGEWVRHTHDDTDELFLVIAGRLTMQMREGDEQLGAPAPWREIRVVSRTPFLMACGGMPRLHSRGPRDVLSESRGWLDRWPRGVRRPAEESRPRPGIHPNQYWLTLGKDKTGGGALSKEKV